MKKKIWIVMLMFFLFGFNDQIYSQIGVSISINKKNIIPYEPLVVTVSLENRAGTDIIFSNNNIKPWIDFDIVGVNGNRVRSIKDNSIFPPLVLPYGERKDLRFNLGDVYPISKSGFYTVRALISTKKFDSIFSSNVLQFNVNKGTVVWTQTAAVPEGEKESGKVRKYKVITMSSNVMTNLYVRVDDNKTGQVHAICTFGRILMSKKPSFVVDGKSNLHLLYMTSPHLYLNFIVNFKGEIISRKIYTESKSKDIGLSINYNGIVNVRGGEIHDPTVKKNKKDGRMGIPLSKIPDGLKKILYQNE